MARDFKGVWIPKGIWLNKKLTLQEKVFLVEIYSLDGCDGCFAGNDHFSVFFGLSKNRCSEIINGLYKKGYISIKYIYKEGTKSIDKRIINVLEQKYFDVNRNEYCPSENRQTHSENRQTPSEKCEDNNTINNNKKEKRKSDTEFDSLINSYTENECLKITVYEFIKHRKSIKVALTTLALKKILNKLDKLASNDNSKIEILENSIMNGWRGIFPLENNKVVQTQRNVTTTAVKIDQSKLGDL